MNIFKHYELRADAIIRIGEDWRAGGRATNTQFIIPNLLLGRMSFVNTQTVAANE